MWFYFQFTIDDGSSENAHKDAFCQTINSLKIRTHLWMENILFNKFSLSSTIV